MPKTDKIFSIFLLIIFSVLFLSSFSYAQVATRTPEVEYPIIGNWRPTIIGSRVLPDYVKYIFNFAIAISGLIVFGALIYGGVRWLTSAGNPTALSDAKSQILASFLGLIILLSSYLILTTIDPRLIILSVELQPWAMLPRDAPGVHLYTENGIITERVYRSNKDDLGELDNKFKKISILDATVTDFKYGAILHKDVLYEGQCKIFETAIQDPTLIFDAPGVGRVEGVSSVTVFRQITDHYGEVKLCTKPDCEGKCEEDYCKTYSDKTGPVYVGNDYNDKVWSIKNTGHYLVVLFDLEPPNLEDPEEQRIAMLMWDPVKCAVFDGPVADLKDLPIAKCRVAWTFWFWTKYESCVSGIAIYPLK